MNKKFNNFYKFIIILCISIVTCIIAIISIAISFFSKNGNIPHLFAIAWSKLILKIIRIKITVKGIKKINPNKTYIYMANHQSIADIPVLLSALSIQFRWIAKAELFQIPVFGNAMKKCGYISINRFNQKSAFTSIKQAALTIKQGTSVLIFPEGTRSKDSNVLPLKKGGFILAISLGVPIVPVVIHGTHSATSNKSFLLRRLQVNVTLLDPIETKKYTKKTKEKLLMYVQQSLTKYSKKH